MRIFLFALCVIPLFGFGQDSGIRFEQGATWQAILEKAHSSNKYIFVDCYATWCGPCKMMDKEVFSRDEIGTYMNSRFICVNVQMDTAANDDEVKIRWYGDAHTLMFKYRIRAFPTYLFFNPEGKAAHIGVGTQSVGAFLALAGDALDTGKQFYTLLSKYCQGQRDYRQVFELLKIAGDCKDDSLENVLAMDYLSHWLFKQNTAEILTKENLALIWKYTRSSQEDGFKIFYNNKAAIDSIIGIRGTAQRLIDRIVRSEEVAPQLVHHNGAQPKPNWKRMWKSIAQKYDEGFADRIIFASKMDYYGHTKNWKAFVDSFESELHKYPPRQGGKSLGGIFDDTWELNSRAWEVFLHCGDKKLLARALIWIDTALELDPQNVQMYDTKANLLYKLGCVSEGIACEKIGIDLDKAQANKNGKERGVFEKLYETTITKMENNEPTW